MFVPFMYGVLTYIGVNGYIIIFTVLYMGAELFQACDIPWRFYFYSASGCIGVGILGGAYTMANLYLYQLLGTSMYAGLYLSLIGFGVYVAVLILVACIDIKRAERHCEGFGEEGKLLRNPAAEADMDRLPGLARSLAPFAAIVVVSVALKNAVGALCAGVLVCAIVFPGVRRRLIALSAEGVQLCFSTVLNAAGTMGVAAVITAVPGYMVISGAIGKMPPLLGCVVQTLLISFFTANTSTAFPNFGISMADRIVGAGFSREIAHRILSASTFSSMAPHSPGLINAVSLTKVPYKDALFTLVVTCWIPGALALAVILLCAYCGVCV